MASRYHTHVDPDAPNNAHAYALELVGWNRRVLELGAASGHVTQALIDRRCRVTSIEFDPDAAKPLAAVTNEVIVGDLNDPNVFANLGPEFDVILAGDVLEHLLRPHDVLARAVTLLKPGGQVVVSVPHVGHADVRLALIYGTWDYRAWGLLDDTHTRFFTLKSIKQMVKEAGLVITDLRRVRIPAFETEVGIDRERVSTEVLEVALTDPEAETYQFVFSAAVDGGDYEIGRLAERNAGLELELDRLRIAHAALEIPHAALEIAYAALEIDHDRLSADSRWLNEETQRYERAVIALDAEVSELSEEVTAARRVIARIDGSVSWQLFQRVRARAFALTGGERSVLVRMLQGLLRQVGRWLESDD